MKLFFLLSSVIAHLSFETVQAQFLDSLQLKAGTITTIATEDYQPLWAVAGRFGTISDRRADLSSHVSLSNKHIYYGNSPIYDYLRKNNELPYLSLTYGLDIYNHDQFGKTFVQEAYVKFNYNNWQLRAGRYEEVTGEINPKLSSGSLGISGNAVPVPKVGLAITEFTSLPLAGEWLQFKGIFSHGWLGRERFVEKAYLHERSLYLRVGPETFRLYGGVNRFVIWGGEHPDYGSLDKSWDAFKTVVLGGSPVDDARPFTTERPDRRGNHLGFIDLGFMLKFQEAEIIFYRQTPYEDRSGYSPFTNPDQLVGISLTNHDIDALLTSLTIEYLDTRYQGGENPKRYDSYYNSYLYQYGWTYLGRTIGTPLFLDIDRASRYWKDATEDSNGWHIVNNRIRGMHLGWMTQLLPSLQTRTLVTYTENHGQHFEGGQFIPPKEQWYFLQEVTFVQRRWTITAALAVDTGEITNNKGLSLGIEYLLSNFRNTLSQLKKQSPRRIHR